MVVTVLISWQGAESNPSYLLSLSMFFFATAYSDYYHLDQKSMTGIVVGVCIALTCILICILILIYRSKARYVFVLEDRAFSQCTDSWDMPSSLRVISSLKYSVSSPIPTSSRNKAFCWLLVLYLSLFSNEKKEESAEWVRGALATEYEACFQIRKHILSQISMLLYIICASCLTLQPAQTWFARL